MTLGSLSTKTNVASKSKTNPSRKQPKQYNGKLGLLRHTAGSYWWLAFVCGIVYFFAGPVFTLLYLNGMNFDDSSVHYLPGELHQQNVEQMARWMSGEGMLPLYLSAVVLSMILGCVMFAYLQHKRQVNFYHSQPIHRTRLFINRYSIGFVMNMVLLLIMLGVSLLMIAMYGLSDALSFGGIVRHIGNILLLSLASYSISVLAGQLTGTVLTHLAIMLVMHFAMPLAAVIVAYMGEIFFATFNTVFPMATLNFSPFCAMFALLSNYSTRYLMELTAPAMGTAMTVTLLAIGIGFAVLSWTLYQKRPSEATGKSLIYPITEPFVKAYLMFVAALGCGFVFYAVGNQAFFYFGVIAFAVLTHMVCQVIIEHDFKAIFHQMKQCAVITVLICAVVGVARFDLMGYDRYLPQPEKVNAVTFCVNGVDNYYPATDWGSSTNDTVKQQVYDLLQPIVEDKLYRGSQFDGYGYYDDYNGNEQQSVITVTYELNSGREVTRKYRSVPVNAFAANFEPLYNNRAYRESYYSDIIRTPFERVAYMNIDGYTLYHPETSELREQVAVDYGTAVLYQTADVEVRPIAAATQQAGIYNTSKLPDERSIEAVQLAKALYEAYQQDLLDRSFDTLKQVEEQTIAIQIVTAGSVDSSRGYSAHHHDLSVYASDKRTMAILEQYDLHKAQADYNYEVAYVFRCDAATEHELRGKLGDIPLYAEKGILTEQELLDGIAANNAGVVTGKIEGKDAINAFIVESKLKNNATIFRTFDTNHYVLLQYQHRIDGTDAREWRLELFYEGTVPIEYQ